MRAFVLACCLLSVPACDEESPTGPTVPLNERITLAPGEAAVIAQTGIRVQFVGVTGDSRCPADAICVWAGDATVQTRVFDPAGSSTYELHTGDAQRRSIAHRDVVIELLELQPYPVSSRSINAADYRATMMVRRSVTFQAKP